MARVQSNRLNYRQSRFCVEYAMSLDDNATAAAVRAGYSHSTARNAGINLLKKPHVQKEIAYIRQKMPEQTGITGEAIIQELAAIAFGNIGDFLTNQPMLEYVQGNNERILPQPQFEIIDLTGLTRRKLAAIGEVIFAANGQVRIKMHDKLGALDRLARILGLYNQVTAEDPSNGPRLSDLERAQRLAGLLRAAREGGAGPVIDGRREDGPVASDGESGEPG